MAAKYIIHGATYNGDGTASNEAASAGAAGAWNDINVLEGTTPGFGSLGAGDVVYIRSKTSGGADITRTLAADVNLGSTAGTEAEMITWILDNGAVWSGISGTLKYTTASWNNALFVRANNHLVAATQDTLIFENTAVTGTDNSDFVSFKGWATGFKLDCSAKTGTNRLINYLYQGAMLERPTIRYGRLGDIVAGGGGPLVTQSDAVNSAHALLIAPEIELTDANAGQGVVIAAGPSTNERRLKILGGRIFGAGAVSGRAVFSIGGTATMMTEISAIGFEFPRAMDALYASTIYGSELNIIGCDGGIGGHVESEWGYATSRTDNNPPYLSAALPDTNSTPWAWRVYPRGVTSKYPMRLPTAKMYVGDAAVKTITQEVLVADSMSPTKKNLWITVEYIDNATGLPKHISTKDYAAGALSSSTANWSATTWGMVTLVKRKLEIATPTAIKPDTLITVTLWGLAKSATANDIYFVDPDFGVT